MVMAFFAGMVVVLEELGGDGPEVLRNSGKGTRLSSSESRACACPIQPSPVHVDCVTHMERQLTSIAHVKVDLGTRKKDSSFRLYEIFLPFLIL